MNNCSNLFFELIIQKIHETGNDTPVHVFAQQEFGRTSLFLGFGKTNATVSPKTHKEIELGSFSSEWRLLIDNRIFLASKDGFEETEFNNRLQKVEFGAIKCITMLSAFDIRIVFEKGVELDYLCCASDDEVFHCFLPNNQVVALEPHTGWMIEQMKENESANQDSAPQCSIEP